MRKLGDSEYREAIEEALDVAEHLIVLSSKPEYVKSKWVKYEWGLFLNDKIDGHKTGNILTILLGFEPHSLGIALRKYESFRFENYKESILNYVETNESKARLQEIKTQREQEEKQRKEKEEERNRREQLKKELTLLAEESKKNETNLSIDIAKIRSILKSLDVSTKKCPVCSNEVPLDAEYCEDCGWIFSPLEGIIDADYLFDFNVEALATHHKIFEAFHNSENANSEIQKKNEQIQKLQNDSDSYEEMIDSLENENKELNHQITLIEKEIGGFKSTIISLEQQCDQKDESISKLSKEARDKDSQIRILNDKNNVLSKNIADKDKEIVHLKAELDKLQNTTIQNNQHSPKSILTTVGMGMALGTLGIAASVISNSNRQRNTQDGEYKVCISFCSKDAIDIIKEYDSSFSLSRNNNGTYQCKINKVIAGFDTLQEAEQLKNQLEYKGATVTIKRNGQVISPAPKSSTTQKRLKDSSRIESVQSTSNTSKRLSSTTSSTYGVKIKHCGINKAKVAQMLSRVYGKTTNSFKQSLEVMPFETTPNLTRQDAEDLLIKLGQIGATVDLYHS